MRSYTYFIDKRTGEEKSFDDVANEFREQYDKMGYSEFIAFVRPLYEEREGFVESPYERCRSSVYATGNRWAIENFNATH